MKECDIVNPFKQSNYDFYVPYLYLNTLKPLKINSSLFLYREIVDGLRVSSFGLF